MPRKAKAPAPTRSWQDERALILKLGKRVHAALAEDRVIVNGHDTNGRRRIGAAVMKEFIEAIEREEHLKPEAEIEVL